MNRFLHRHRRLFASAGLGLWAFAVSLGIANACCWDGATTVPHHPTTAAHSGNQPLDGEAAPDHERHCSDGLPLAAGIMLVQVQPASQPLVLAAHHFLGFPPTFAPALRCAPTGHLPSGVPLALRTVRLAL